LGDVLRLADVDAGALRELFARYGLALQVLDAGATLPGSYWGESEAGLVGGVMYLRPDTPLHSALHEGGHFVCMDPTRRAALERDAGGDDAEECAVCLLQLLLADELPGVGRDRLLADMDAWGYSFRLGSAAAWLREDAEDARRWLERAGVIDAAGRPTGQLRA
jgi:hypothetical protein